MVYTLLPIRLIPVQLLISDNYHLNGDYFLIKQIISNIVIIPKKTI